jgi:mono/diheme cytochrome c family protein
MTRPVIAVAFCLVAAAATGVVGQRSTADKTPSSLLTPSLVGRDNFTSYCAPCHGREGTGNGPVASALKTRPPDLTKLARRAGGTFPRQRIEAFITNGGVTVPAHGSSEMPVWGPTFMALELPDKSDKLVKIRIGNVVSYIESIQVK